MFPWEMSQVQFREWIHKVPGESRGFLLWLLDGPDGSRAFKALTGLCHIAVDPITGVVGKAVLDAAAERLEEASTALEEASHGMLTACRRVAGQSDTEQNAVPLLIRKPLVYKKR